MSWAPVPRALGLVVMLAVAAAEADADETFTYFEGAFLPTAVTITAGDTITWEWAAGSHTVTSGESSDPEDNPGELFDLVLDEQNPTFSYEFTDAGIYSFFCRNHETGLVGTIVVEPFSVDVGVVNNAFTPQNVEIFAGDQVEWFWIEGIHTITSGASSDPMDDPGALFDEPNTQAQPVFIHQFNEAGFSPYFCRPHEVFDMTGTVLVQKLFIRGDTNGDGTVNIADPIALLAHLFQAQPLPSCGDAADANDTGTLDIADAVIVLTYLFAELTSLPPPFPFAGADRTVDVLLCE